MYEYDTPGQLEDHPDYPNIIDEIEKYGNWSKEKLVTVLYDESGKGMTKKDLRLESKGTLLAWLIDELHGGKCH